MKIITRNVCHQLNRVFNAITQTVGKGVAWLLPVMVLLTALVVFQRLLFNSGSIALQEAVTYLHAAVIMFAGAYTLAVDGHVRVDIFYRRFSAPQKAWVDTLGAILFLLPLALFSILVSWEYVMSAWRVREGSADAGGIPAVYWLKTLILINGLLLTLQALADLAGNLLTLTFDES